jgi:hypothetical protein
VIVIGCNNRKFSKIVLHDCSVMIFSVRFNEQLYVRSANFYLAINYEFVLQNFRFRCYFPPMYNLKYFHLELLFEFLLKYLVIQGVFIANKCSQFLFYAKFGVIKNNINCIIAFPTIFVARKKQ